MHTLKISLHKILNIIERKILTLQWGNLDKHPILINLFILNLFLAALGLGCCARAFSSCDERGLLFLAVRGLLIAVASLVAEHGL